MKGSIKENEKQDIKGYKEKQVNVRIPSRQGQDGIRTYVLCAILLSPAHKLEGPVI